MGETKISPGYSNQHRFKPVGLPSTSGYCNSMDPTFINVIDMLDVARTNVPLYEQDYATGLNESFKRLYGKSLFR